MEVWNNANDNDHKPRGRFIVFAAIASWAIVFLVGFLIWQHYR